MNDLLEVARHRRAVLKNGLIAAGALAVPSAVLAKRKVKTADLMPVSQPPVPQVPVPIVPARVAAAPITSPKVVRPALIRRALASLDAHGGRVKRDRVAIADFAAPSSQPRFHLVDMVSGKSTSFLVAHGSGSDPSHTGWLSRFSNEPGSNASCEGAFVTDDYYVGKHGRSQRLVGLDPTNNNALARAIVVHAAWYSNPDMLKTHGMLGRSQGCFAVGDADLARVFDLMGPGRMIYAAKV